MKQNVAMMFTPNTEIALQYVDQMLERTLQLARSQLEVTERLRDAVGAEYRSLLSSREPSVMLRTWPTILENTVRNGTVGTTAFFKNAMEFQTEQIQTMRNRMLGLNGQFGNSVIDSNVSGSAGDTPAVAAPPRPLNGGRARKAA